jgi:hypothetical protein
MTVWLSVSSDIPGMYFSSRRTNRGSVLLVLIFGASRESGHFIPGENFVMTHNRCRWLVVNSIILCSLMGCRGGSSGPPAPEGPMGTASGVVQFEGKPITEGMLVLDSGNGYLVSSPLGPDGKFQLRGPHGVNIPVRKYKVGVSPQSVDIKVGDIMAAPPVIKGLPNRFYSPFTSGVTVEILEGSQELKLDLK